jgi:hypothetical protein
LRKTAASASKAFCKYTRACKKLCV